MSEQTQVKQKKNKINWEPYWLILPTLLYLALFFIWPLFQGLSLAIWDDEAALTLQTEAQQNSAVVVTLPTGTQVDIVDQQENLIAPEEATQGNLITEMWFQIVAEDVGGCWSA